MGRHTKRVAKADTRQPVETHKTQVKLARHLGKTARAARLLAKLTQADVAERVGIATEVYGRLERGAMLPSAPTLRKLCSADLHAGWPPAAGAKLTDSPQPQAPVWFGLENTNWDASLSVR